MPCEARASIRRMGEFQGFLMFEAMSNLRDAHQKFTEVLENIPFEREERMTEPNGKLLIVDLGGVVLDNHHVRAAEFVHAWNRMLEEVPLPEAIRHKLHRVPEETLTSAIWSKTPMEATNRILAAALTIEDRASSQITTTLDFVMRDSYEAQRRKKQEENLTQELSRHQPQEIR